MRKPITLSGRVVVRYPVEKPAGALQRVDRLVYHAKEAGRNQILIEEILRN